MMSLQPTTPRSPAYTPTPAPPASPLLLGATEERLAGYHRDWEVIRPEGSLAELGRLKVGGSRPGIHHFDPRCFTAEEDLLVELARREVPRVPAVYRLGDTTIPVHSYIEGNPLALRRPPGSRLSRRHLHQLLGLFGRLAAIRPSDLALLHHCPPSRRARHSGEFLRALVRFTREQVYHPHLPAMHTLFAALGIGPQVLAETGPLARAADQLTHRPFCLLHGDLHRDNLIVAAEDGALWTIDWELALLGDPLYDLATHLHLMGYPPAQQLTLPGRWSRVVEEVLPGASAGLLRDLPVYLQYKRVQSVFTDVIRHGLLIREVPAAQVPEQLARASVAVSAALRRAAGIMRLESVPEQGRIEAAYAQLRATGPREPLPDRLPEQGSGPAPLLSRSLPGGARTALPGRPAPAGHAVTRSAGPPAAWPSAPPEDG
ncbi:aminoglycoside phosphotransferase family protein [Streptomyces sp. ACA25]|uniref:aminoglycoside phosphotransferase family protein n=1 Tax=Streptomyces sp. ACA25 TaxID=3022596 RepID=UPI0023074044|nr:aminoglycoside phosphotransferase family protein [Streptomyces sp. ACA25]MDB1087946.1 aminoglycoside phosphotransferase family protein [Streptomyces sp. ACA25]